MMASDGISITSSSGTIVVVGRIPVASKTQFGTVKYCRVRISMSYGVCIPLPLFNIFSVRYSFEQALAKKRTG
ncbi:hypothetical protein BG004_000188 [Podila humilis]|nr:hypothetical protein BG004_000188 [Podila humilis]